jgi:hypothetical protein
MTTKYLDGVQQVEIMGSSVIGSDGTKVDVFGSADGIGAGLKALVSIPYNQKFNGINWDRERNNTQGTLLASAARTATATSPNQTNYNAKGVQLTIDVTAVSGTGGLILVLQGIDQ